MIEFTVDCWAYATIFFSTRKLSVCSRALRKIYYLHKSDYHLQLLKITTYDIKHVVDAFSYLIVLGEPYIIYVSIENFLFLSFYI